MPHSTLRALRFLRPVWRVWAIRAARVVWATLVIGAARVIRAVGAAHAVRRSRPTPVTLLLVTLPLAPPLLAVLLLAPGHAAAVPGPVSVAERWQWPLSSTASHHYSGTSSNTGVTGASGAAAAPEVTRHFDPPDTPYGPGHRGVDLAGRPGTAVLAAGSGVVSYAGVLAGRGVVAVTHADGLRTTYEPVRPTVRAGQRVTVGDRLGLLRGEHPGCPRPACLHWGLLRDHTYLDPLGLLRHGPVRLLPIGAARSPAATVTPEAAPGAAVGVLSFTSGRDGLPSGLANPGVLAAVGLAVVGTVAVTRRRGP